MESNTANQSTLLVQGKSYVFYDINKLPYQTNIQRLPYCLKILLENLCRYEDGSSVTRADIEALAQWSPQKASEKEIAFSPARVLLQDFTGVPAIVDLATMRHAMQQLGGDPAKINPLSAVELVIDHSVMVDYYGDKDAFAKNVAMEFQRNEERYAFLRWGQKAFKNFRVVPPGTGIVHQVNLEYLGRVVCTKPLENNVLVAYPDTLVGTDSHTTMINGLGILGWGVGGIEAEAAMLGQPITLLVPKVLGFQLIGQLPEGATATDLVLRVTEMLRTKNVVGQFVEFYGEGLKHLPIADRATIANMAPEYGATCGLFPIDAETLRYLRLSGRDEAQVQLIEAYTKAQGFFHEDTSPEASYNDILRLDLSTVEPCIAGPRRPHDRIPLRNAKMSFQTLLNEQIAVTGPTPSDIGPAQRPAPTGLAVIAVEAGITAGPVDTITHGSVVIAAITSCTNTSNPHVMIAAGLLAKKALEKGLKTKSWVKTSLAPGSQVVTDYLKEANLLERLENLGFNLVGYGCTTCIGNSGPLDAAISQTIREKQLSVAAVLSGNRNFEGRIQSDVRLAYLASPPLVVAYALAGTMNIDFYQDPIGYGPQQQPIYLRDIWPSNHEIHTAVQASVKSAMFKTRYQSVFQGDEHWESLNIPDSEQFDWKEDSTYIRRPPYFEGMPLKPAATLVPIQQARVLVLLGDSVTTDHISPAGSIAPNSPAARYLEQHGVAPKDFNSYGSRRGNHEVMIRGTFANPRLRNDLLPHTEGSQTLHLPSSEVLSIYDAALRYQQDKTTLIVIAGKDYGSGSSRDWAAKGPRLLGVSAVIAQSFERIHRSNLIGMGIVPLEFLPEQTPGTLGLDGREYYTIDLQGLKPQALLSVQARAESGSSLTFQVRVRIDTPKEMDYIQQGGILHYVLRNLLAS